MQCYLNTKFDKDSAEFWLNSQLILAWSWQVSPFGATTSAHFDAIDFFPPTSSELSEFYVDSIVVTQLRADVPNLPQSELENPKNSHLQIEIAPTRLKKGEPFLVTLPNTICAEIMLYNSIGQKLFSKKNIQQATISAPETSGIYLVIIKTKSGKIYHRKIVVQ